FIGWIGPIRRLGPRFRTLSAARDWVRFFGPNLPWAATLALPRLGVLGAPRGHLIGGGDRRHGAELVGAWARLALLMRCRVDLVAGSGEHLVCRAAAAARLVDLHDQAAILKIVDDLDG